MSNVAEMKLFARSIVRDQSFLDAHFIRHLNLAYRSMARGIIIPKLNAGEPVELVAVSGSTQRFYLPYDFQRTISFFDSNGRSLDILPSEDVRQFGEYNALGSFVQFYEHTSANITPLYDSFANSVTCGITNRGTTVTASSAVFTDAHVGEWLMPINRNTSTTAGNPEDYGYLISATSGTTASPSTTCTIARPFRGVLSDAGTVADLTTGYFEIRPRNTPIIRIWGNPSSAPTVSVEYQRMPSKLANPEDTPEDTRLCEALVYRTIESAGWAFKEAFMVKGAMAKVQESLQDFKTSKDFDRELCHNFITGNPMARSHGMVAGRHLGSGYDFSHGRINY